MNNKTVGGSSFTKRTVHTVFEFNNGSEMVMDSSTGNILTIEGGFGSLFSGSDLSISDKVKITNGLCDAISGKKNEFEGAVKVGKPMIVGGLYDKKEQE